MPPKRKGKKNQPTTPKKLQDPHNVIPAEQKDKGKGKKRELEDIEMDDGGASGSSVVATQAPSITDIKRWSTEQLIQHLQAKFPDDLIDEDFGIFQKQRIRGNTFLTLTEEKLMADGMKRGPAAVIAGYVNELNATEAAQEAVLEEHAPKRKFEEDKLDVLLTQLQALREDIREDKKTTVSISRMTQKHFTVLLEEHEFRRDTVVFSVTPTTKPIQSFTWGDKKEDTHAQGYLGWLKSNINLPPDVEFYTASSNATLLNTTLASSQMNFNGTLDVAIVDSKNVISGNIVGGIRVGIETKKTVKNTDAMQVIAELITANVFSVRYPVVILLTDLRQHWQFFWLQTKTVVDCVFDLKEGITLLETIVQQPCPFVSQPTPNAPYLQRCDFRTAISQARESDDALPEDTEVGGLERLLQRPKVDIMGLLPEDDVADMRDVFDVMTPKEIREWQLRRVLDFVMQTPAMQSSMKAEDWRSMYA